MYPSIFSYIRVDTLLLRTGSLNSCGRGHFYSRMETWESREERNSAFSSETNHLLPQVAYHRWTVLVSFTENLFATCKPQDHFTMSSSIVGIGWLKPKVRQTTKHSLNHSTWEWWVYPQANQSSCQYILPKLLVSTERVLGRVGTSCGRLWPRALPGGFEDLEHRARLHS